MLGILKIKTVSEAGKISCRNPHLLGRSSVFSFMLGM
jgi:hypothetical protein